MTIDIQLPLGPFRQAISTVFGALIAFVLVSMLGAAVVTFSTDDSFPPDFFQIVFFVWIAQWAISGIMLWGFIFVILQVLILYDYVFGSRDRLFNLTLLFANQVVVSTIVLITFSYPHEPIRRPLTAGLICLALAALFLRKLHRANTVPSP